MIYLCCVGAVLLCPSWLDAVLVLVGGVLCKALRQSIQHLAAGHLDGNRLPLLKRRVENARLGDGRGLVDLAIAGVAVEIFQLRARIWEILALALGVVVDLRPVRIEIALICRLRAACHRDPQRCAVFHDDIVRVFVHLVMVSMNQSVSTTTGLGDRYRAAGEEHAEHMGLGKGRL